MDQVLPWENQYVLITLINLKLVYIICVITIINIDLLSHCEVVDNIKKDFQNLPV